MRPNKDLLLAGAALVVVIFTRGVPAQDCYKFNFREHEWQSPGEYDDTALTTGTCKARCGQRAFLYSATQNGKYCFCTNAVLVAANKVTPSSTFCNIKCTGGPEMCGGASHITVDQAIAAMEDPWMKANPADTIIETGKQVSLQFGVTAINEEFHFDLDDGAGSSKSCKPTGFKNTDSDSVKAVFHIPGVYNVRYEVESPEVPSLTAAVGIVAQSKVTAFRMQCPEQVAKSLDVTKRDEEYACTVETFTGSAITATFDFGTSKRYENVAIADPVVTAAGPGIPQYGTCTGGTADKLYVMPGSEFTEDGTIIGWEFNMETTGDLSLLVLEPKCASDTFCGDSYKCQATCEMSCSTNTHSFCTSNSLCTAHTTTTCPTDPRSQTPTFDWTIKHVVAVPSVSVGYNYIDATTVTAASLNVTRGMVLGAATKAKIGTKTPWTGPPDYSANYIAPVQGATIAQGSLANGAPTANKKLLVRAIASKASVTKVYHHCLSTGDYDMTATLSTSGVAGTVTQKRTISCLEGIDQCILDVPDVAESGKAMYLRILEHKGTNNHYLWNYDDGSPMQQVDGSRITQNTFAVRTYNVCVECKNAISSKSNCTTLEIKDKIGTVTVTTTTATAGVEATIKIAISKGTGYNCSVDFGDGTVTVYDDTQLPINTGEVKHTYATPNKYTVTVACQNGITPNPEVQTATQEVQEKLTSIAISPPGAKKGDPVQVKIQTNVQNGYGVTYTCTASPPFKANTAIATSHCDNKPSCESTPISDVLDQTYQVSCTATNKLGSVDTTIDFTIDAPLDTPLVVISKRCDPVQSPPALDGYYIMVPSCVEFTATIKAGSNAFVSIEYGDGTADLLNEKLTRISPKVISHQYTKVGTFEVVAKIGNGDGVYTWKFTIKAFKKMNFQCDIAEPQKSGTVEIKFKTPDGTVPPEVAFSMDFGDGTTQASSPFNLATPVTHHYTDPKTYTATTTFTNPVETYTLPCTFQIIEAIMDPQPFWTPEHAICNTPGTDVSLLMQVGKGSGMNVTYDWNYPSSSPITVNFPKSLTPALVNTQRFDTIGSYTCTVTIANALGSFTFTHKVYCEYQVHKDDFEFTSNAPRATTDPEVTFTLKWIGTTQPTDASGEIQYGKPLDGREDVTPMSAVYAGKTITKTYGTPGCRTAKMVIKNFASSVTWEADASIQDKLENFYIEPKYRPAVPLNGADQPGSGNDKNHFPSNRDIKLYPVFYRGKLESVDKYELIAESSSYVWLCNSTDVKPGDPLIYKIPAPGTYKICITASNQMGSVSNCTTVIVGDTPHGITIDDSRTTTKPNEPKTIKITLATVGTDPCVAVNFDFKNSKKWHLYGKITDCKKAEVATNMNLPSDAEVSYIDGALTASGLTLTHTYTAAGQFEFKVIGANYLAASSASLEFSVSKDQKCQRPDIMIDDARPFEDGTRCDRGSNCKIRGKVASLNCDPQDNIKTWTMERMNDDQTVKEAIDITSCTGHNGLFLTIPRHFAGAGLGVYRLTLTVQMTGSSAIRNQKYISTAVTYIWIVRGPIYASMIEGGLTGMTLGKTDKQTFRADIYSVDSDVSPSSSKKTEFRYLWFARQTHESYNPDPTTLIPPTPITGGTDHGGCFGNGVGRLDIPDTMGTFTPDFSHMPINGSCNITVIVKVYDPTGNDERSGQASVVVKIVEGKPPIVSIICSDERFCMKTQFGQRLIRPSGLLKLRVKCLRNCPDDKAYREQQASYRWKIRYSFLSSNPPFDQVDSLIYVPDVPKTALDSQRPYVGEESEELTLLPPLFEKESNLYQAELTLSYLGLKGIARMNFTVNRPPKSGICSISPTTGTYISTKFVVSGAGWSDDRKVMSYEIYVTLKQSGAAGDNEFVHKYNAEGDGATFALTSTLRQGNMDVKVRVYDDEGAYTECTAGQVTVSPTTKSTEELASGIDDAFKRGNPGEVAAACVDGLNAENDKTKDVENLVDLSKEGQPLTPEQEDKRAQGTKFVEDVLNKLEETPVNLGPKETIEIASALVRLPSLNDRVVAPKIQKLLAITLTRTVEDTDASVEDRIEIAAKILACGKYLELGEETTKRKPGKRAKAEAKEKARPDMSLPKDGKSFDGTPSKEEDAAITSTNNDLSDTQSDENLAEARRLQEQCLKLMASLVPTGGSPMVVKSGDIVVLVQKDEVQTQKPVQVKQGAAEADIQPLCSQIYLPICDDPHASISSTVVVSPKPTRNPKSSKNGPHRSSPEVEINFLDDNGDEIKVNTPGFEINFALEMNLSKFEQTPGEVQQMEHPDPYNSISITATYDPVPYPPYCDYKSNELYIRPVAEPFDKTKAYMIFIAFDKRVNLTSSYYNATIVVPKWGKGTDAIVGPDSVSDPYTVTLDEKAKSAQLKAKDPCKVYVGLRELDAAESQTYSQTGVKPNVNNETLASWKSKKGNVTANLTISTYSQSCSYYDEAEREWSHEGCWVDAEKCARNLVVCKCNHLTSFAGGWVVVPNKLDFNFIFANLDFAKNPSVYATLIVITILYIIGAIVCRRADMKDVQRACVYPMVDNDPDDKYMYEVVVATGMSKGAGTHSKVYFVLSGENDETDVRVLHDRDRGNKHCLNRGNIDSFLLTTPRPLGDLNYARIWHDNSGKGKYASWYLKYFLVHDLQSKKKYQFILNRWLAVEEDDGQIDRLIPVAGLEQMVEFGHLFSQTTRKNFNDEHLWISLVGRPPRSRFTRLQRCSCCFQLLALTMMTSAMFYGIGDTENPNTNALEIGPFTLSPQQLSVGVMSNLVIFPATFLTVWMFRKTRPKKKRRSRIQEAKERKIKEDNERNGSASVSDVNAEVTKNEEMEMSEVQPVRPPPYFENDIHGLNDLQDQIKVIDNGRPESPPESKDKKIGISMEHPLIKKRKKKFSLPPYCRIISWVLLWVCVAIGMTISFFYGVQFGETKAKKWITSMMVAFLMSVFITQPIKVFLVALFFSLVLKKADDDTEEDEEDEEEPELQYDEQWLNQPNGQGTFGVTKPRMIAYKPPDPAQLEKYRENRLKELKMYSIIKEILSYCLYVWVLLSVSYSFRDPDSYTLKEEMVSVFIHNNKGDPGADYRKINTFKGYWDWTKDVLLPALIVDPWYDHNTSYGQAYGQRGFISDRSQRHMGYAVMRQLRAKPFSCEVEKVMQVAIAECVEGYGMFSQEESTFGIGWTPYNATLNNTREEYTYTSAFKLDGLPYVGNLAVYAGGGYVARLQGSDAEMMANIDRLIDEHWLDAHTRAIFVEFTVYNPNINLFAVATILTEFPGSTAMVNTFRFEPINLLGDYHGNGKWYEITCQVLFCAFLLLFIYRETKVLIKEKAAYFKHMWNLCEIAIIGLSIGAIAIYFYRYFITMALVSTFKESHGLAYIKFQYVAYWNELLLYMVGWLVFLANLKFLRLLRFNKRMGVLGSVLRHSRKDMFAFGIMFSIIFFAYVQFFYLIFLRTLVGYKSFIASAETSLNIMLGKFDFKAMLEASPILAPFFFFLFVVTIVMVLINMFLSILNEAFTVVKNDVSKQSNDYEMVDFIMRRFKSWTGIGRNEPNLPPGAGENTLIDQQEGMNGMPVPFEKQIDKFPEQIDKLLNSISKVYFDHDKIDALLDPSKMGKDGKATMKMMMKQQQMMDARKQNQASAAALNIHMPMPDVESIERRLSLAKLKY